jgi:hypothetical protein
MAESPADRCLRHCGLPHRSADPGARSGSPDATTQALGEGLFQVRFYVGRIAERITYFFAGERRIVLLTRFAKQRMKDRAEIERARAAMVRCVREGHTAEEDNR